MPRFRPSAGTGRRVGRGSWWSAHRSGCGAAGFRRRRCRWPGAEEAQQRDGSSRCHGAAAVDRALGERGDREQGQPQNEVRRQGTLAVSPVRSRVPPAPTEPRRPEPQRPAGSRRGPCVSPSSRLCRLRRGHIRRVCHPGERSPARARAVSSAVQSLLGEQLDRLLWAVPADIPQAVAESATVSWRCRCTSAHGGAAVRRELQRRHPPG